MIPPLIAAALTPLHASPLDAHFHWGYQILTMLTIIGLWLFLAGRAVRRGQHRDESRMNETRMAMPNMDHSWSIADMKGDILSCRRQSDGGAKIDTDD